MLKNPKKIRVCIQIHDLPLLSLQEPPGPRPGSSWTTDRIQTAWTWARWWWMRRRVWSSLSTPYTSTQPRLPGPWWWWATPMDSAGAGPETSPARSGSNPLALALVLASRWGEESHKLHRDAFCFRVNTGSGPFFFLILMSKVSVTHKVFSFQYM